LQHDVQQHSLPTKYLFLLSTASINALPTTITPSTTNPNSLIPFEIHREVPSTYWIRMLQVKQQQQLALPFASNIQTEVPIEIGGP
jgi:hypothetical protein